ncbi:SIMPL domain-containing protein [Bacillus sp. JCM 19034]|uniref:SIMPL domain-containing protein n=1 Tax=Bacillus sp. JCM 19034 TaxID=1481928 RepID=UPI000785F8A1|nr:SIMPL domain-containing protein [Bacillus sp. JCM 19034]
MNSYDQRLTVFGQASESSAPNKALLILGTVTENQQISVAQAENSARITNVVQQLETFGVSGESIQTESYRVSPEYDYIEGQQILRGYRVTHLLKVDVARMDLVGTIIDAVVEAGANSIVSISFMISDESFVYEQALTQAIENAKQKAEVIAGTIGAILQPLPTKVIEHFSVTPLERSGYPMVLSAYSENPPFKRAI